MFFRLKELKAIKPAELDQFLAKGWFRMNQDIFTTGYLNFNDELYQAVWLRICLDNIGDERKYTELKKRNATFTKQIVKAVVTEEHELLYSNYAASKPFEPSNSLTSLLFGDKDHNVYDTYVMNIYDNNKLIAFGCFDFGKESAAGICSIYDPLYKKYSLGIYTIYEKIMFCKQKGLQYFYPGYFVPGYPAFDYKLSICKAGLEYYDFIQQLWQPV